MVKSLPHGTRRAGPQRSGFTLVELVVVIAITGILAAVTVAAMSTTQSMRSRVACRELARDLAYARERSITTGVGHWVVLNITTDSYTMLVESNSTSGRASATAFIEQSTGSAFKRTLNTGDFVGVDLLTVSIGTGSEIGFDWRGRPLDSTSSLFTTQGVVTLSSSQSVTIQPLTGLVAFAPSMTSTTSPRRRTGPHYMRRQSRAKAFTLIEAIIALTVLSLAVPGMFWAVRDAAQKRTDPVMISRARWLASEKLEDIIADRNSTTRGYTYVVTGNYAAEATVSAFTGFSRSVSITETASNLSSAGTGYKTVAVTVSYPGSTGTTRSVKVSTVISSYTP